MASEAGMGLYSLTDLGSSPTSAIYNLVAWSLSPSSVSPAVNEDHMANAAAQASQSIAT